MKKVVIGIAPNGQPYVVHKPRKVEVVFKKEKKKSLKKRFRTWLYHLKQA
jgi:hypothetical protein